MDITTSDVQLLIRYASEKGKPIPPEAHPFISPRDDVPYTQEEIVNAHSALSRETAPITSDSLKDSDKVFSHTKSVLFSTVVIVLLILATSTLSGMYAGVASVSDAKQDIVLWIYQYILVELAPFLWGALGSCVFILKKISDLTSDRLFRSSAFHGTGIRIVLGAVLGGVINDVVIAPDAAQDVLKIAESNVNALAFLTGLSVKVVYGGLEKLIDTTVDKFALNRLSSSMSKPVTLMTLAAEKLQKIDTETPEGKKLEKTLQELISQL
jgi:hypothetical protein